MFYSTSEKIEPFHDGTGRGLKYSTHTSAHGTNNSLTRFSWDPLTRRIGGADIILYFWKIILYSTSGKKSSALTMVQDVE